MKRLATKRPRAGFTILELTISSTLLVMMVASLALSLSRLSSLQKSIETEIRLQDMASSALATILDDLRRSAFVDANGVTYPHLFEDGNAALEFNQHDHQPAIQAAQPGDPDFGPIREIVFVLPDDADGDGVPDLDPSGEVIWTAQEFSYVLNTGADGINRLERRTDALEPATVAQFVERVEFDSGPNAGNSIPTELTMPFNTVRVRIWFRAVDGNGHLHTYFVQASTRFRNTPE